jgi:hypothetical protein
MQEGARRPATQLEPGLSLRSTDLIAAVLRAQIARFNFIRNRILRLNEALGSACASDLGVENLAPHRGDVPFTVLFRRPTKMNYPSNVNYPSLAESGWHVAAHVPWLATTFADAARDDASLAATYSHLAAISAVGAGFVDPYYAIPLGLRVTDTTAEVPAAVQKLREFL